MIGKAEFPLEQGELTTSPTTAQFKDTELHEACFVRPVVDIQPQERKEHTNTTQPQQRSLFSDAPGTSNTSKIREGANAQASNEAKTLDGLSQKRRKLSRSLSDHPTDIPKDNGSSSAISATLTNEIPKGTIIQLRDPHSAAPEGFGSVEPSSALHTLNTDGIGHSHHDSQAVAKKPAKQMRLDGKGGMNLDPLVQNSPRRKAEKPIDLRLMRPQPGKRKCTVAAIRYGVDEPDTRARIALRIESILQSPPNPMPVEKSVPRIIAAKPAFPTTTKATHPFFVGKRAAQPENLSNGLVGNASQIRSPASRSCKSYTTPRKFRPETAATDSPDSPPVRRHTSFRLPGTHEALWPAGDFFNNASRNRGDQESLKCANIYNGRRKLKTKAIVVTPEESLLNTRWQQLRLACDGSPGKASASSEGLQVPQRLVMTGSQLRHQLNSQLHFSAKDSTRRHTSGGSTGLSEFQSHPAVRSVYNNLPNVLGPFDKNESDNLGWQQKYAPQNSADVLQTGREMHALKSWLQGLIVTSVKTQINIENQHTRMDDPVRRKKRRKIHAELDDFIVGSDDDTASMQDLNDIEANNRAAHQSPVHSVIRDSSGDTKGARSPNVVMLSGPSGCGKSAAVYAVAKELGFDVFEINPGSRRSGKDVLDRVGNMTQNHLVHQTGDNSSSLQSTSKAYEPVVAEVISPKQKSLQSFFGGGKMGTPKSSNHTAVTMPDVKPLHKPGKHLKQSLILLEEVDILFEDDKQFWETILGLAFRSKRPIIMTCNDESLIPLQTLSLHAILRFQAPPADLATDYLLLVAAAEGHTLERPVVKRLYECCNRDLRATLAQLSFSCQMGLGDRKGGFEWLFKRWPKGSDLDAEGRKLRVISRGTYHKNLDRQDADARFVLLCNDRDANDQLLTYWERHGVSPWDVTDCAWIHKLAQTDSSLTDRGFSGDNVGALRKFGIIADVQSDADVFCKVGLPGMNIVSGLPWTHD